MNGFKMVIASLMLTLSAAGVAAQERLADSGKYAVVINHEEQYSIWVADRPIPKGWQATGFVGKRAEALDHIEEVWQKGPKQRREVALRLYQELKAEHGKSQ